MNVGLIIQNLREAKGMTQKDLADKIGIHYSVLSKIERGDRSLKEVEIVAIADYFGVSTDYLLGKTKIGNVGGVRIKPNTNQKIVTIDVLGVIPAGMPIEAIQEIIDTEEIVIPRGAEESDYFALAVRGDSMEPVIRDGYVVIVKKQSCVENNEIAVVLVNGYDATLKRVKYTPDGLYLIADNQIYPPKFFTSAEVESLPVRILGRAIEFKGKL